MELEFPIVITKKDFETYLTKRRQQKLKVIVGVIKGFKEMEQDSKERKKDPNLPEVIVEQAFIDEEEGSVIIREYDMNAPNSPPTCRQLLFDDPLAEGCIAIDWTEEGERALSLAGVKYTIYDPDKPRPEPREGWGGLMLVFSKECESGQCKGCFSDECMCSCHEDSEDSMKGEKDDR